MATIWKKTSKGKTYEVKSAGSSIRLYTDGVFHTQFNHQYPLGGSIWDLLVLPILFNPKAIKKVLILGLGGGSVVRTLRELLPETNITALELNPIHIQIARKYFNVKSDKRTRIIEDDAIDWINSYCGVKFDFILDDLFVEQAGQPLRATLSGATWTDLLLKHLATQGVLAVNFDSPRNLRDSPWLNQSKYHKLFKSRFSLSVPGYENRVAAFFKSQQTHADLKNSLADLQKIHGKQICQRLNYRIRQL